MRTVVSHVKTLPDSCVCSLTAQFGGGACNEMATDGSLLVSICLHFQLYQFERLELREADPLPPGGSRAAVGRC